MKYAKDVSAVRLVIAGTKVGRWLVAVQLRKLEHRGRELLEWWDTNRQRIFEVTKWVRDRTDRLEVEGPEGAKLTAIPLTVAVAKRLRIPFAGGPFKSTEALREAVLATLAPPEAGDNAE